MLHSIILVALFFAAYESYVYSRKIKKANEQLRKEAAEANIGELLNELSVAYKREIPGYINQDVFNEAIKMLEDVVSKKTGEAKDSGLKAINTIKKYRELGVLGDYQIDTIAILAKHFATK